MSNNLTVAEAAVRLRKSVFTVRRMIHARLFDGAMKIGRDFLIPETEIEALCKRCTVPGRKKP